MPWLQLRIHTDRDQAAGLEDALLESGAVSVTLQDNADQPILEPALGETPLWDKTLLTGLFDADIETESKTAQIAASYRKPMPQHRWELLEDKDWEREWMKNYQPIHCGGELWICPSWLPAPDPEATNLMLDPGLAFGTGTHPTTFMCLQWLAEQGDNLKGLSLVDYGCGSGILGIAALLFGAQTVVGTDIDPQALTATADNAERNGLARDRFPVYLPKDCPAQTVDVTLANILAGPLAELAPELNRLTRPGGRLCLSGILNTQAQAVMDAYQAWFDFDPIRQQEEWVCLTATKRQP
ncbi:50S ribosomal protein L11 methyltransferase [Pseudomaricurvus alkylphenolicus]|uniref:50S ribosomal protein L11 methyltransferase n=1 Tax=Pseudomaricurvus alkylphenolicus TaxID=1306991 RepID=UPI00142277E3|nr:50S ribosomal protein L11 methyltransferase [Pseudomaricurvus alkylphenolicus]NIB39132.1 50S ribosomal protein L11 methyltransferase [Pseudomaricurvus alkylphenolicus]